MGAALTVYLLAVLSMFMALVCMAFTILCTYRRQYVLMVGFMVYTAICIFCTLVLIEL